MKSGLSDVMKYVSGHITQINTQNSFHFKQIS